MHIEINREGDYLVAGFKANERLLLDRSTENIISELQQAYSYFSDKPVVKVEAYGDCYLKIPALQLIPVATSA